MTRQLKRKLTIEKLECTISRSRNRKHQSEEVCVTYKSLKKSPISEEGIQEIFPKLLIETQQSILQEINLFNFSFSFEVRRAKLYNCKCSSDNIGTTTLPWQEVADRMEVIE